MIIRPTGAGAPPPAPRENLEALVRDVLETGVEIRSPRRFWFGTSSLNPAKAAEKIREQSPNLTVTQPGLNVTLPLRSEQDLKELAVFHDLRPISELEHPEVGEAVGSLEKAGFELVNAEHQALSLYGAYNAVTDPGMQLGPLTVQLADHEMTADAPALASMATFYNGNPLGQLEIDGYHFYDDQGQRRFAWGDTPPAMVGDLGEAWLPATGPDLEERLKEFAVVRQETGNLKVSQQIAGLTAENFPDQARGLLSNPQAVPGVVRAAGKLPTERLAEVGRALDPKDPAREAWLKLLKDRPETTVAAKMGLAIKDSFSIVLRQPCLQTGVEAATVLGQLKEHAGFGPAALDALREFPDTKEAAEAVGRWTQSKEAALKLLENPTDASDAHLTALAMSLVKDGQKDLQKAILTERAGSSARARLGLGAFQAARKGSLRDEIFRLTMESPELVDAAGVAALARSLASAIDRATSRDYPESKKGLATATLAVLGEHAPAGKTVADWGLLRPEKVAFQLAESPGQDLWALAATLTSEEEAQKRILQQLSEPAQRVGLALTERVTSPGTKDLVFRAAIQNRDLKDGAGAARLMGQLSQVRSEEDEARLGPEILRQLQSFPDTQPAADLVAGWTPRKPHPLAMALLDRPTDASPENLRRVAAKCDPSDRVAQGQILAGLDNVPAQELLPRLTTNRSRGALLQAALGTPSLQNAQQAVQFYGSLTQNVADSDQSMLGSEVLTRLQAYPETKDAAGRAQAWGVSLPYPLAQKLLKRATDASPESLRELARGVKEDAAAQNRILEELKADPRTARTAELCLPLFTGMRGPGKEIVFQAALAHPEIQTGAEAAAMLAGIGRELTLRQDRGKAFDQNVFGQKVPAMLAEFPDTRPVAEQVSAWQAARPFSLAVALSKAPLDASVAGMRKLAMEADESDKELLKRIFQGSPGVATGIGLDLLEAASDNATRKSLLQAVMVRIEETSDAEMVDLIKAVRVGESDSVSFANAALKALERLPSTREAAEAVQSWGSSHPGPLVQTLLQNPSPAALRTVARQVDASDVSGQKGILAWLGDCPAAQIGTQLHGTLRSTRTRREMVECVVRHADLQDGAGAAALFGDLFGRVSTDRNQTTDERTVARTAIQSLQTFPDTKAAADVVAGWQLASEAPVAKALVKAPTGATPEAIRALARRIDTYDGDAQIRVLTEMKHEVGLKLIPGSGGEARHAILMACLDRPEVRTGAEAGALMASLGDKARAEVARQGLEILQQFPDTKAPAGRVAGWQPTQPYEMIQKLIEAPTDNSPQNLRAVAAKAAETTPDFFRGVVNGLAEPANRDLGLGGLKVLRQPGAWQAWSSAVLQHAPVTSGVEAADLIRQAITALKKSDSKKSEWDSFSQLATELLAKYPDTAEAARVYASWGTGSSARKRLEFWLADPTFANRTGYFQATAGICAEDDQVMQGALLEELGQSHKTAALMARAALAEVRYSSTRLALFQTALEFGDVNGTEDVKAFFKQVGKKCADEKAKLAELEKLYEMSFGLQGRSASTLAEEENRLLVGGVVVKKKD